LKDRKQFVFTHDTKSKLLNLSCGVPQGSNLCPLLILVYINDLPNAITSVLRLFADNTCIYVPASDTNQLQIALNDELQLVDKWSEANKMIINPSKSAAIILTSKKQLNCSEISLNINNSKVSINNSSKYLGLQLDKKLEFKWHIESLEAKLSRSVGILSKLRHVS